MPTLQISARDAVSYDDSGGPGPLIVLVHGSPGTSRAWQPVAERLAARFRVIAPNLPGYGGTTRAPEEAEAFASTQALFEDYRGAFEGGDRQAARKMVDYWFGVGVFDLMPASTREFLIAHTSHNLRDIRATFRDPYSLAALGRLAMPVLVAYGSRSPDVMARIVQAIVSHVPRGDLRKVEKANHALTSTHPDAVAALITELADRD